jgi:hypothetical protein
MTRGSAEFQAQGGQCGQVHVDRHGGERSYSPQKDNKFGAALTGCSHGVPIISKFLHQLVFLRLATASLRQNPNEDFNPVG